MFGFGRHVAGPDQRSTLAATLAPFLAVFAAAAFLFFSRIACPLQEPEEPRYAEIPRQMLETGNYVMPVLHGLPYYDKPPLLYWLVMTSYKAFGVHDWSARLISSLAAFLTVVLTYCWGTKVFSPRTGLISALMLCLSVRFVLLGRLLTMNSLLCFCVVAALSAGHLAIRGSQLVRGWWMMSACACGLGLLTKGPVALALVIVPLFACGIIDRKTMRPGVRAWLMYAAIALGLAAPWYLALAVRDPSFVSYFFWKHNLLRYVDPFDHAKPIWFYVDEILLGMLPWSLLLAPMVIFLCRRRNREMERPTDLPFFLFAALWCFTFYSLSGSKRAGYVLPAMPLLALALGCYLNMVLGRLSKEPCHTVLAARWKRAGLGMALSILATAVAASTLGAFAGLIRPTLAAVFVGIAIVAMVATLSFGRVVRPVASWAICATTAFVVLFVGLYEGLPRYARKFSLRGPSRQYARLAEDPGVSVVCYPRSWDSVGFYLHRSDVQSYARDQLGQLIDHLDRQPRTLAFIKSDGSDSDLLRNLPDSVCFVPAGRQGYVAVGWLRRRP
jgi:dolichol-phosphate mannosyltransferase